jgi:putative hydrolase of the HAD superfamily
MIRAVISDLGRVVLWVDEIRKIVHRSAEFIELFDLGKLTPRQFYERASSLLDAKIEYDDFFAAYTDVFCLNRPALDVLMKLKGKYRLILLSNTDPVRFGFVRRNFPEILFFDDYVLSYEVGAMKPDPRIYEVAVRKAGAPAAECVFVDDMEENVAGAAALGLKTILYKPDTDFARELSARLDRPDIQGKELGKDKT